MPLSVDTGAAARPLNDEELRVWAQNQTVFISSVMRELAEERRAVAEVLEALGVRVRWFEEFGGRDDNSEAAYLSEAAACTIYLGLLGDEYGSLLSSEPYKGFSATHAEYLEARTRGKRISFWARKDGDKREGHARKFLDELYVWHVTGNFVDAADLARRVDRRLREIAAEDVSPWVKVGDIVVRASRIRAHGNQLIIDAQVYERDVLRRLEEASGGGGAFRSPSELPVTYGDRSGTGGINDLQSDTTSGHSPR